MLTFQQIILKLQDYWDAQGCALLQPYDMEVGAGTSHTATFLRAIGPEPWRAAYVQPSRRPKDGRYGENPNRLQHYYQYQVVLKPAPENILDLYLGSLAALGLDLKRNDVRFVEDDWENPTLGAWGLGWEVWLNGMEVTQFTYFQQVGGLDCKPVLGEITYGIERLAMYLQGVENVYDLVWTEWVDNGVTKQLRYGDVFHQNEVEQSTYNFEHANTAFLFPLFGNYEAEAKRLLEVPLALPAYEMVLKAAHTFNLLDARGAISVTERAAYMGRIRNLSRAVAQAYYDSRAKLGFPMWEITKENGALLLQEFGDEYMAAVAQRAGENSMKDTLLNRTLLIEIFTEELPPKALAKLGDAFANGIFNGLKSRDFLDDDAIGTAFATPRRLAVSISNVRATSLDKTMREKVLPVSIALDADGRATAPLIKKLAAMAAQCGKVMITPAELERAPDGKADSFFYSYTAKGVALPTGLQLVLEDTVAKLPIPKVMSYQRQHGPAAGHTVRFVRPAHSLVALHGEQVLPLTLLGLEANRQTEGHRFLSPGRIILANADSYATTLAEQGKVVANFSERKEKIRKDLLATAADDQVLMPEALLDEVTALVEWPVVYACKFEDEFLNVPQECLILTMQTNQKYFALTDSAGKLRSRFLIVSNLQTNEPHYIIEGNERVVRPRLSDAKFFFEQDQKKKLAERVPSLANVVYHNKLGNQLQRTDRVKAMAAAIATLLGSDAVLAERAALLAKADLLTDMVGEFPELQGIMGNYYARHDGEADDVALAISEHYQPRFAGDALPTTDTSVAAALADKLETLVGIWGIGLQPTGDKDPFALRRHALGILRMLLEKRLPISLTQLLSNATQQFTGNANFKDPSSEVLPFLYDRLRGLLREQGYTQNEVEAVVAQQPDRLDNIVQRLAAVQAFAALPEAEALAAANKRITNILKKTEGVGNAVQQNLLRDSAEESLFAAMNALKPEVDAAFAKDDFSTALKALARLRENVDGFFNDVMVMADDAQLRNNRLALLANLHAMLNQVADISKLVA